MHLERFAYLKKGTLGKIELPNRTIYTLELPWKDNEPFVSCIPCGEYRIELDEEGKYTGELELQDVPGRSEIVIHPGNWPREIKGCIAPGLQFHDSIINPAVWSSKLALKYLKEHLKPGNQLTITDVFGFRSTSQPTE